MSDWIRKDPDKPLTKEEYSRAVHIRNIAVRRIVEQESGLP